MIQLYQMYYHDSLFVSIPSLWRLRGLLIMQIAGIYSFSNLPLSTNFVILWGFTYLPPVSTAATLIEYSVSLVEGIGRVRLVLVVLTVYSILVTLTL